MASWMSLWGGLRSELDRPEVLSAANDWLSGVMEEREEQFGEGEVAGEGEGEEGAEGGIRAAAPRNGMDGLVELVDHMMALSERRVIRFFSLPRPAPDNVDEEDSNTGWVWICKLDRSTGRGSRAFNLLRMAEDSECLWGLGVSVRKDRAPKGQAIKKLEAALCPKRSGK